MIAWLADDVLSPLGASTMENYRAVAAGRSALLRYERQYGIAEPFVAALFPDHTLRALSIEGLTRFESLACRSAASALGQTSIDIRRDRVAFILSTTKANIELLDAGEVSVDDLTPATAARHIAQWLGISAHPFVVCNACISGVSAIVLALRLLEANLYDYAVVCGADVQSRFTISGFQSLKALSAEACRPFDIERTGLNLGEAASTIIFGRVGSKQSSQADWAVVAGAVSNDAFHISSPSKDGEGARSCLASVLSHADSSDLAFINAHGTATLFNDQMESVAIERAGLGHIPVNALKGFFGHTLGAAGILETVLSKTALEHHTILETRGYDELGVSGHIHVAAQRRSTQKGSFIKMISGFGGCNGAILVARQPMGEGRTEQTQQPTVKTTHVVHLTSSNLMLDGQPVPCEGEGKARLTNIYKRYLDDYPKYYKMDSLSRLGYVAAQLLLKAEEGQRSEPHADRAIILFNHSSSVMADRAYEESIRRDDDYYPSPAAFVYTLPNIVAGEIAIRNHYRGETSFYILDHHDDALISQVVGASLVAPSVTSVICGWIDYPDDCHYEAQLEIRVKSF